MFRLLYSAALVTKVFISRTNIWHFFVHSMNIKEAMALRGPVHQVMNSLFADNKKCKKISLKPKEAVKLS